MRFAGDLPSFDAVASGPADPDAAAEYAAAGATWYQVGPGQGETVDASMRWIDAGPPR